LTSKLEEALEDNTRLQERALENDHHVASGIDQLQAQNEKLKSAMLEQLDEKEELEAKVSFLMEEVEKLEDAQNIPKEINAVVKSDTDRDLDKDLDNKRFDEEREELRLKVEELQAANESLRVLVQESQDKEENNSVTSQSYELIEQRLTMLEKTKDAEISNLQDEKTELENIVTHLESKLDSYEREVKELTASNQIYANEIKTIKAMRKTVESEKLASNKKKKSIQERLAAIESRSVSGSISGSISPPKSGRILRAPVSSDDISQVSGISSVFSSSPSRISPPMRSRRSRSHSRTRLLESLEFERPNSKFDRKYTPSKNTSSTSSTKQDDLDSVFPKIKKDVDSIVPSTTNISRMSLKFKHSDTMSAIGPTIGTRSRFTSRHLSGVDLGLGVNRSSQRPSTTGNRSRWAEARDTTASSTRERIMAILDS